MSSHSVLLNAIFGGLATLSFILLLWQWIAARRFPLHQRNAELPLGPGENPNLRSRSSAFLPAVTFLKSLKGADAATEDCLRSWFMQDYAGEVQILFGVVSVEDPVCGIVNKLMREFPKREVRLEIIP